MSLIFNALKRNRSGLSAMEDSGGRQASPPRKALTLGTLLSSPKIILLLASSIFLSGVLVAYVVQVMTDRGASAASPVRASVPQYTAFTPQPDEPPVRQSSGSRAAQPMEASKPVPEPETGEPGGGPGGDVVDLSDDADADADAADGTPDAPWSGQPSGAEPTPVEVASAAAMPAGSAPSVEKAWAQSGTSDAAAPGGGDARTNFSPTPDEAPPPAAKVEKSALEIQRERRSREHLETHQLAGRIMIAIQSGDNDSAAHLFAQMEKLKGPDHIYVLKMKAYWMIQQDRLDQARTLLAKALVARPEDFEAGLNLAVVDIMDGHHDQARRRLERLQQLYPEKTAVSGYLEQLDP